MEAPEWHVHEYNEDFYILRESGCVHYEKPFLYLIFGNDRALLLDTGAGRTQIGPFVNGLISKWLTRKRRSSVKLMVMHSHGHGDHIAGDGQFRSRPGVQFVAAELPAIQAAFGITSWPQNLGQVDLGGRIIDLIPLPGHQEAAVALYDRRTAILLTGDSVYPGRLYVNDWNQFAQSVQRLVDFARGRIVAHVLGGHIEQTSTPYMDYPVGSIFQPSEHTLELSKGNLLELNDVLIAKKGKPARVALRDLTIFPMDAQVSEEMRRRSEEVETAQRLKQWDQFAGK